MAAATPLKTAVERFLAIRTVLAKVSSSTGTAPILSQAQSHEWQKANFSAEEWAALHHCGRLVSTTEATFTAPGRFLQLASAAQTNAASSRSTSTPEGETTTSSVSLALPVDGSLSWDPAASEVARLAAVRTSLSQLQPSYDKFLLTASRRRRALWGGAVLFTGTQLAMISRLTFFDFDWDLMEPVSYFIGQGTSLCFFAWMLAVGREHTYDRCDRMLSASSLSSKFWGRRNAARATDANTYLALKAEEEQLVKAITAKREWCGVRGGSGVA